MLFYNGRRLILHVKRLGGRREDVVDAFHVEFEGSVVVVDAVVFLLDIGQLGEAPSGDVRMFVERRDHAL